MTTNEVPRLPSQQAGPAAATPLGVAASRALPAVLERRGTQLRDTKGVARRLATTAVDLFATRGFDEVTITEIAEAAGVNRRTFFRYFPSKETIVLDIWDQTNDALVELVRQIPGDEPFETLGRAVIAWCKSFAELMSGLAEIAEQSRTLRSATLLHSSEWEEKLAETLVVRFPDYDPDVAEVAAIIAMGSMRAAYKRGLISGNPLAVEVARVFDAIERARH